MNTSKALEDALFEMYWKMDGHGKPAHKCAAIAKILGCPPPYVYRRVRSKTFDVICGGPMLPQEDRDPCPQQRVGRVTARARSSVLSFHCRDCLKRGSRAWDKIWDAEHAQGLR